MTNLKFLIPLLTILFFQTSVAGGSFHCHKNILPEKEQQKLLDKFKVCIERVNSGAYKSGGEETLCDDSLRYESPTGGVYRTTGGLFDLPSAFLMKCTNLIIQQKYTFTDFTESLLFIHDDHYDKPLPDVSLLSCVQYFKDLIPEDLGPWKHFRMSKAKVGKILSVARYIDRASQFLAPPGLSGKREGEHWSESYSRPESLALSEEPRFNCFYQEKAKASQD